MAEASLRTRSAGGGLASDRKNGIRMAAGKDHAEACKEYGAGQKKIPRAPCHDFDAEPGFPGGGRVLFYRLPANGHAHKKQGQLPILCL